MKRKLRIGILSLTISILVIAGLPKSLAANSSATLSWSGSDSINMNGKGDMNLAISGITGSGVTIAGGIISVADTSCLSIESITPVAAGADANIANGKFAFMNPAGMTTNATFVKVTLKAGSKNCSTTISLTDSKLSFKDTTKLTPATLTKTINVVTPSSDATLKTLSPNTGSLSPAFNPGTTNYTIGNIPANTGSITFNTSVNDPKASVTSGKTCNLSSKVTTCNIVVKAEDGTTKTYEVVVTKRDEQPTEPAKSSDATLKSLDVSGFTLIPTFKKDVTSYSISVNNNITGLNVTAIPNDEKAKVTISGNNGWKEGVNTVRITVTAEDGSEKVYIVNVNRKPAANTSTPSKSANNYLESIIVNNGELKPGFDKNNNSYNITVPNDVESLDLKLIAEDKNATINIIGNDNFKLGMNVVTLEVRAEDGSLRVYTINVNRSEKVNQNKLKDLIITNGEMSPSFDSNKYEYEVTVSSKENKLDITAIPEFANSDVEIIGNNNLREGNNAILIKVTDENGFVQYYRLNVEKEGKSTFLGLTLGQWLLLLGSLILIGLLIFILILLLKKRKEEETPKIPVVDAHSASPSSPVIEFKPEFNFGSKNGTDDDVVESGGVLNQYTGFPSSELKDEFKADKKASMDANYEEIPYDPYDATVTKDEIFDAINEAIETKDSKKLKLLYEQERLNREKEALRKEEETKKSRSSRYHG